MFGFDKKSLENDSIEVLNHKVKQLQSVGTLQFLTVFTILLTVLTFDYSNRLRIADNGYSDTLTALTNAQQTIDKTDSPDGNSDKSSLYSNLAAQQDEVVTIQNKVESKAFFTYEDYIGKLFGGTLIVMILVYFGKLFLLHRIYKIINGKINI